MNENVNEYGLPKRTLRQAVEQIHPEASTTHRWQPEYGDDNIECAFCGIRPYNAGAEKTCPYGEVTP